MRELEDRMLQQSVSYTLKDFDKDKKLLEIANDINPIFMQNYNKFINESDMQGFINDRHKFYTEGVKCFNQVWD